MTITISEKTSLLEAIKQPADVRKLPEHTLPLLAKELRDFIIHTLNECGGHFAGNLGTIELAIALHYVFDTPKDQLVWDVGHQAYPHKVLTGRKNQLHTIRQTDGLAPFPCRDESSYDAFTTGHSSTAISAALGMAIANQLKNNPHQAIAIIGDGGLTGGMAFEALNHAGSIDADLLVILNDNEMSISENVGALTNYLARILSGKTYSHFRKNSIRILDNLPSSLKRLAKRTEAHLKGIITPGTLFEELGLQYFGPIDGHDLQALIPTLQNLKNIKGPKLLHVATVKGKGYAEAEADPIKFHAVKPGFLSFKTSSSVSTKPPTYSEVFGRWLSHMANQDERLLAITPAMCEGSGMVEFSKSFSSRYFDVGIAEQHSVTLAAGLACEQLKPVVAIYSTFLQRAYDQLIHDVALPNLDVTFAIDRAGLVGGDGATHNGNFDLSYLRCIPNIVVMAPADENECWQMLTTAYHYPGPAAVRYPRGEGLGIAINESAPTLSLGKAEIRRQGKDVAFLSFGSMLTTALQVSEDFNATVVNMRFIKPLDEEMILNLAKSHHTFVTFEENTILGGAGSAINELIAEHALPVKILNLGLPDQFIAHGNPQQLLIQCGLSPEVISLTIANFLNHDQSGK